ncbi:Plus-end-directed kinesin ATPase [Bertholletia excelsa]
MLRDFKFLRRRPGKNSDSEEIENVPTNPRDMVVTQTSTDSSRPPLNIIQEPTPIKAAVEHDVGVKRTKIDRTPSKAKGKVTENSVPLRTPEKPVVPAKYRFGWAQKNESSSLTNEFREDTTSYTSQLNRGSASFANTATPRSTRPVGRANSSYSECSSTQSTPTKSVTKPPNPGFFLASGSRPGARTGNYAALSKGLPITCASSNVVNTVEVPHFDLKEDPSFWMEHNVQVLIRIRPLNSMERSTSGYNRCLKQESAQCITWLGQPETRFTFDHVACETIDQETLFRMVGLPMVENCLSGYNSCMFAYGQTGSGKTFTMLGEIDELEIKASPNRGMTPRMFEFLFARIRAEEESRRDERLTYNCKCSFLEIYNEQISDLLDPSSTNLLLREDTKKEVYVENLTEFEVHTVSDILKLLSQGSSNRKVAATNMNRESSRSHSVFTCVIESRWEKDATSNLRFARLNLVDLAGSERQKSSGAEGERLKEAANINKSLSTLGHVIMVLVDVASGKPRHVPYRDSRLTFLLQDSLGGNSKTMIIANVSPSICCAAETLNTLKFAQRAKLIQNNAVVNEDSSGDVIALQHQIRMLKEELSALKRQNVSRFLSFAPATTNDKPQEHEKAIEMNLQQPESLDEFKCKSILTLSTKQLKSLESTLAGALRRERMAETSVKRLEAEIEQLNRLVRQREEDTRCTKMMLKFREDKIQRMESLVGGLKSADEYLREENKGLSEEIQLLQAKVDRNPEVTRFALENIRLLEQLRRFQDFYEEGEREMLLAEVSELRDQMICSLDGNLKQSNHSEIDIPHQQEALRISKENDTLHFELNKTLSELEECRDNLSSCLEKNARLSKEIDDLRISLNNLNSATHDHESSIEVIKESISEAPALDFQSIKAVREDNGPVKHENPMKDAEEVMNLQLEVDILKIILNEERSSHAEMLERQLHVSRDLESAKEKLLFTTKQCEDVKTELKEAQSVIDALESQQIFSINELEDLRNSNSRYAELLSEQEHEICTLKEQLYQQELKDAQAFKHLKSEDSTLQGKLKRMQESLEMAKRLNSWYQSDRENVELHEEEMDEVRKQVEAETAEVIVCLQDELTILQRQVQDSNQKEVETKEKLVLLQTELMELQEKMHLLAMDNKILSQRLEEKDGELTIVSREWELLANEIELLLSDGNEALEDASDQLDLISSSFPSNRSWISEHIGRIRKVISDKELCIQELNQCLEDANNSRSDMESMLRSLRGATLVITEAHEHECREKEKQILLLTSELSEINNAHLNALSHKDACHINQAAEIDEANKQIQSLRKELLKSEENSSKLQMLLSMEQDRACAAEQKFEEIQENVILKTSEQLTELKSGVSTLRSFMNEYTEQVDVADAPENHVSMSSEGISGEWTVNETKPGNDNIDLYDVEKERADTTNCLFKIEKNLKQNLSNNRNMALGSIGKDDGDKKTSILLLKSELEYALESLERMQEEMANLRKLHVRREEVRRSEKQNQKNIKNLLTDVLSLQATMDNFEKQLGLKMKYLDQKLLAAEETVRGAGTSWCWEKELLELELGEAKVAAIQKTAEASCILAKFEEAQHTIKEADIIVNGLTIANETMKLEMQNLQSSNDLKELHYTNLEKQFESDFLELKGLIMEMEHIIAEVQTSFNRDCTLISTEFLCMKSQLLDSMKLTHSWVEDIWSDIVVKDCAVSVLHLCHMGILLETVNGLNAENGLLFHGLSESNSVISELREHNFKSSRELEMCRILKGKLLTDIKSGFDRISKKETETGELNGKLRNFEKKILDLQFQEELMLKRSNHMGSELAMLTKELDLSNGNILASLLDQAKILKDQEQLLKDQEEVLRSQEENFVLDLSTKDLQLLILASELKNVALSHDVLEGKLSAAMEAKMRLSSQVQKFEAEYVSLHEDVKAKAAELESLLSCLSTLDQQNKIYQDNISMLEASSCKLQDELKVKDEELSNMICLKEKNESLESELQKLKLEYCSVLRVLEEKESELGSYLSQLLATDKENHGLQDKISSLESQIANLQVDLEMTHAEFADLQLSQSVTRDELCSKGQDLQFYTDRVKILKEENMSLETELRSQRKNSYNFLSGIDLNIVHCVDSVEKLGEVNHKVFDKLKNKSDALENWLLEMCEKLERTSKFMEELECLETLAKELMSENLSLQTELSRKDDVLNGLLFDLSLLQESASNTKDQKDEIEILVTSLKASEDELSVRLLELDQAVVMGQILEAQLQEKISIISTLQLGISKLQEAVNALSSKNLGLTGHIEDVSEAKRITEEELTEKRKVNETLETELIEMGTALGEMNSSIESLKSNLDAITNERDDLLAEVLLLKEKLEMAEALAEESNAVVTAAQEMAENRKLYAEEKEKEVKLLERSVEELERTVNVLENKVDIVKGEAERQRLQREELEMELDAVKEQMHNVKGSHSDVKRHLEEKEKHLQETLHRMQVLEREIAVRDSEIAQCKHHISELNLHAEAQACEYKQKFKALEAMAEQVKPESVPAHGANSSSSKLEKNGSKSRGSSSPFKCIGLGMVQQIKSERDEELAAGRLRIEELEALAASRQKEIFMLNARLATAESMTHDVIRDLLGLKLDMTNYASLLDNQQVQKMTEKARLHNVESQAKDQEVMKLKQQLNEFIEERKVWLEEIDRKQAEMVAAEVALEKLHQRDRLLSAENEMFKMENSNHKRKVMELEAEVKKLSGQQNLQQRIHHHAKIKEENNFLKNQNDELSVKLRRTEAILARIKEELACFRTSNGRSPHINFDEEQRLNDKLKETEDERLQLAQKLLGLCTSILKAAGISRPASDISVSVAEEALEHLMNRIASLERELEDVKLKNKITNEKIRLLELMPQTSPFSSRADDNHQTPNRATQSFLSSLDR